MLNLRKNRELRERYEQIFSGDPEGFFGYSPPDEAITIYQMCPSWDGKKVLEIGCGGGHLANLLALAGATVTAIDYAASAIKACRRRYHNIPNLSFINCSFEEVHERYDTVVMGGVLEHMDDPLAVLQFIKSNLLVEKGEIINNSPSFLNARGYIWMALQYLFGIPMSLTDVHFLCPFDFEDFAKELGMEMRFITIKHEEACGPKLIEDFKRRLPNACRDKGMKADVDKFLNWLGNALQYPLISDFSGREAVYHFYYGGAGK